MLTFLQALDENKNLVGVVISKLEPHRGGPLRGYIAMLAVREEHRGRGIATKLVCMAIDVMIQREADEVQSTSKAIKLSCLTFTRSPSKRRSLILQQ